jgi:glyoxylase-like metal-dependent hydrolase (beta-lactamase superfamily II)/rhodanese-related sulfurtransferase
MHFEQFYLNCLAHASYMLASEGEAVVIDPQRDVDIYLQVAKEQNLQIRHIFETHLHADFVSGHKELAARTGAKIYIGAAANARFPHVALRDGFELQVGKLRIKALETPGHTPESVCLVVTDEERSARPWAVFTGDTLFIGDVGRPDLSPTQTPQQLAGLMYDSLHNKLMILPDDVIVYPAHGAGSLCGRNMRADKSSTIGIERLTNYALQIKTRDEFVQQLTTHLPSRPEYFSQDAEINRSGAAPLTDLAPLSSLAAQDVKSLLAEDVPVLDVRTGDEFAAGHISGSINIALSGQFASWAGSVFGLNARPVLVAATEDQVNEARMRLARIGIEDVRGYLAGGIDAWRNAGFSLKATAQMTVEELRNALDGAGLQVLDVRREGEWQAGHLAEATWHALDYFRAQLPELDPDSPVAVHCKSGYRSMIACSMLERAGFKNVSNIAGGFDAWKNAGLPVVAETPA